MAGAREEYFEMVEVIFLLYKLASFIVICEAILNTILLLFLQIGKGMTVACLKKMHGCFFSHRDGTNQMAGREPSNAIPISFKSYYDFSTH